jgi:hypothetical protein
LGAALASCPRHFSGTIALKNRIFGASVTKNLREQFPVATFRASRFFGKQLFPMLGRNCGERRGFAAGLSASRFSSAAGLGIKATF